MKKRLISFLLCAVMLLSILPFNASADSEVIKAVFVSGIPTPVGGSPAPFDSDLLVSGDPALYSAYYWDCSWRSADGCLEDSSVFTDGERYTLSIVIVPVDGATVTNAYTLPVYINGQKAKYNSISKPEIPEVPGKEVFAYEIELQCAWSRTISVINVDGVVLPTPSAAPSMDFSVPDGAPYTIGTARWERYLVDPDVGIAVDMTETETFKEGGWYYLDITFIPKAGYEFADTEECRLRINGSVELVDNVYSRTEADHFQLFSVDLPAETRHIDLIEINGLRPFYVGEKTVSAVENATVPAGAGYSLLFTKDMNVAKASTNGFVSDNEIIVKDERYAAIFRVVPNAGWTIDSATEWSINGMRSADFRGTEAGGFWYIWTKPWFSEEKPTIDKVSICGITAPALGLTARDCMTAYVSNAPCTLTDSYWYCDDGNYKLSNGSAFEEGKHYTMCNVVKPMEGFVFAENLTFELNEGEFEVGLYGKKTDGSYYVWTITMEPIKQCVIAWYLDVNDEDPVAEVEVPAGTVYGDIPSPSREGFIFGGWFTDKALTKSYDPAAPITKDTNLYPKWIPEVKITAVDVTVAAPAVGEHPATKATLTVTPADTNVTVSKVEWFSYNSDDGIFLLTDPAYVFQPGVQYGVTIYVTTDGQSVFDPAMAPNFTINGESKPFQGLVEVNAADAFTSRCWEALPCPHTNTEVKNAVAATCTAEGYTGDTFCTACGEKIAEGATIRALGHDLVADAAVAATCTATGLTAGEHCSRCDYIVAQKEIPALGHDYVVSSVTAATCTESGSATCVCSRCGDRYTETLPELGHDFKETVVLPTCTEKGYTCFECFRCGYTENGAWTDPTGHQHAYPEHKDATCTEDGYDRMVCDDCGAVVSETVIPALGHAWDDGRVTTEPTATKEGVKTFTCARCGATRTEAIPATGETEPCDGGKDCPSYKFTDVKYGDWYHEAVDFAVVHKLFNGMTETTFEPNTPMTRAMLVTVLWRYEGEPAGGTNSFTDVKDGEWYTKAVAWAAENEIVTGVGNNKFDPSGNITREQMAAILYRYSESKGYETEIRTNLSGFPDRAKVSAWAKDAMEWAVAVQLITGNAGNLDPQGSATRAQVATILMRFIEKYA